MLTTTWTVPSSGTHGGSRPERTMRDLLEWLLGPGGRAVRRSIDVEVNDDQVEVFEGESWSLSENGSVDRVRVTRPRFYPSCGCAVDRLHPLGGRCSICHQTACVSHFSNCADCGRPICNMDSKLLIGQGGRVCRDCAEWHAPEQLALRIVQFLRGR